MTSPQIVSLFSGVGGLEMGIQAVVGGDVVAHVEFDAEPSQVLAHHWPDVPNLGDITTVDWFDFVDAHPELVEMTGTYRAGLILCGGFPCQDVSLAGRRAGMKTGTRSGLWSEFARAIDELRPELVVIENVRGLLSAEADRNMESSPWGVGDRHDGPALRALGAVLGDLADLGYDADWCGLRAADAGAPHGRYRIFVIAYPADASRLRWGKAVARLRAGQPDASGCSSEDADVATGGERGQSAPGQEASGRARADAGRRGGAPSANTDDSGSDGRERSQGRRPVGRNAPARDSLGRFVRRASADSDSHESERWRVAQGVEGTPASGKGEGAERERIRDATGDRGADVPDTDGRGLEGVWGVDPGRRDLDGRHRETETAWGDYEPAIRRWEAVLGSVAPSATQPSETSLGRRRRRLARLDPRPVGMRGSLQLVQQLAPRFVEWMMGYPAGHVVDAGISRNGQLKALGNAVCPQQAALALRTLLS